jgi:hypothetical protein
MRVTTLEGVVEDGRIRLIDSDVLPENKKVYVIVPDTPVEAPRIWSPRLANPGQLAEFTMEVQELSADTTDARLQG